MLIKLKDRWPQIPNLGRGRSLQIYVDESGTMPLKVSDGDFSVAAVGTTHPTESPRRLHTEELADELLSNGFLGSIITVRPNEEYEKQLAVKNEQMAKAVAHTRDTTGANKMYVSSKGFQPRNHIWSVCATLAVSFCITKFLERMAVSRVEVVFDSKSLSSGARLLLSDQFRLMKDRTFMTVANSEKFVPEAKALLMGRMRYGAEDLRFLWSDEDPSRHAFGLHLADLLAGWIRENEPEASDLISQESDESMPPFVIHEASAELLRPLEMSLRAG